MCWCVFRSVRVISNSFFVTYRSFVTILCWRKKCLVTEDNRKRCHGDDIRSCTYNTWLAIFQQQGNHFIFGKALLMLWCVTNRHCLHLIVGYNLSCIIFSTQMISELVSYHRYSYESPDRSLRNKVKDNGRFFLSYIRCCIFLLIR